MRVRSHVGAYPDSADGKVYHQNCKKDTRLLTDPQSAQTIDSIAYTFTRIGSSETKGLWVSDDGLNVWTLEKSARNRNRYVSRVERSDTVEDPFTTGSSFSSKISVYTVFDWDPKAFTAEDVDSVARLAEAMHIAGTPDNRLRFLKGEI